MYPRLFRGRYRLATTLEMIATQGHQLSGPEQETRQKLGQIVDILFRCGLTGGERYHVELEQTEAGLAVSPALCLKLLDVAAAELRSVRKQLRLGPVVRDALFRRDERPVWLPHWEQRHRETFHDGVAVAELLVALRRKLVERDHPSTARRPGGAGNPSAAGRAGRASGGVLLTRRLPLTGSSGTWERLRSGSSAACGGPSAIPLRARTPVGLDQPRSRFRPAVPGARH